MPSSVRGECDDHGGMHWREPKKESKIENAEPENPSIRNTVKIRSLGRRTLSEDESPTSPLSSTSRSEGATPIGTNSTSDPKTTVAPTTIAATESGTTNVGESGGLETQRSSEPKPTLDETLMSELSVRPQGTFEQAGLTSMRMLHKSANRLLKLMGECVTDSDLDRSKDGVHRVESHRIELAIQAANAIATTVQTQANLVKSMASIMKGE